MIETNEIKLPKELTDLINKEGATINDVGIVFENLNEERNTPGKEYVLLHTHISKKYLEQRGLKTGDKIVIAEYPLNGKQNIDVFKIE